MICVCLWSAFCGWYALVGLLFLGLVVAGLQVCLFDVISMLRFCFVVWVWICVVGVVFVLVGCRVCWLLVFVVCWIAVVVV